MNYYRFDPLLWDDEDFCEIDDAARAVWLALAFRRERTALPGLMRATVASLADTIRRPVDYVESGLRELARRGIVEVDARRQVMRVTRFFAGDWADSPNQIVAWFKRWLEVPSCELRMRHIATLERLAQTDRPTHRSAWDATFEKLASDAPANPPGALSSQGMSRASAQAMAPVQAHGSPDPSHAAIRSGLEGAAPAISPVGGAPSPEPSSGPMAQPAASVRLSITYQWRTADVASGLQGGSPVWLPDT